MESFYLWNPEYNSRNLETHYNDWNPESKFHWQKLECSAWNLESTVWNPESKTVLDSLTWCENGSTEPVTYIEKSYKLRMSSGNHQTGL